MAQICGLISTVAAILCVQARTANGVLLGQILANGFSALSYGLLGSISGAWVCLLAAVHSILISRIQKRNSERKKWTALLSIIFAIAYIAGSVITYTRWPDVISCICALLFVVTIAQEDAARMRNVMLCPWPHRLRRRSYQSRYHKVQTTADRKGAGKRTGRSGQDW